MTEIYYQCPTCSKIHTLSELKEEMSTPYSCFDCGNYLVLLRDSYPKLAPPPVHKNGCIQIG